jgi:hypothetical protein
MKFWDLGVLEPGKELVNDRLELRLDHGDGNGDGQCTIHVFNSR